jgi:hypothetical protein
VEGQLRNDVLVPTAVAHTADLLEHAGAVSDEAPQTQPEQSVSRNKDHTKRPTSRSSISVGTFRLVYIQWTNYNDVAVSFQSRLPFTNYVFYLNLAFRKYPLCNIASLLPGPGIGFSRVIEEDSNFLWACYEGDLARIRQLFQAGEARPDDITRCGWNPLMV